MNQPVSMILDDLSVLVILFLQLGASKNKKDAIANCWKIMQKKTCNTFGVIFYSSSTTVADLGFMKPLLNVKLCIWLHYSFCNKYDRICYTLNVRPYICALYGYQVQFRFTYAFHTTKGGLVLLWERQMSTPFTPLTLYLACARSRRLLPCSTDWGFMKSLPKVKLWLVAHCFCNKFIAIG